MPKGSIKIEGLEGFKLTQKQKIFCEEYLYSPRLIFMNEIGNINHAKCLVA
jgi:hypothetical protein